MKNKKRKNKKNFWKEKNFRFEQDFIFLVMEIAKSKTFKNFTALNKA